MTAKKQKEFKKQVNIDKQNDVTINIVVRLTGDEDSEGNPVETILNTNTKTENNKKH